MSGVGEALAIVGVVAGLIQALEAGTQIVKQIKERRQAHRANGALPPSDQLEKKLVRGTQQIQQLVEEGQQRFGPNFEADETAEKAIMQITIQIQNALLLRLTQARSDDGVIDFEECIDLSDQGCNNALLALRALYQRRLTADMNKKRNIEVVGKVREINEVEEEGPVTRSVPQVIVPKARTVDANIGRPRVSKTSTTPLQTTPPKKSRFNFSRKLPHDSNRDVVNPMERLNIASGTHPAWRNTESVPEKPILTKHNTQHSISSESSHSTNASTPTQKKRQGSWTTEMSRVSTMATTASVVVTATSLAQYSGTCKYAYKIREGGCEAGLEPQNTAMHGQRWVICCKSAKCRFRPRAIGETKKDIRIRDSVYNLYGVQFRWSFLAKSHIALNEDHDALNWPYTCLLCIFLNQKSDIHYGVDNLMHHISSHKEQTIGANQTAMCGPLCFNNINIEVNDNFDIMLSELSSPSSPLPSPRASQDPPQTIDEDQRQPTPSNSVQETRILARATPHVVERRGSAELLLNPWILK